MVTWNPKGSIILGPRGIILTNLVNIKALGIVVSDKESLAFRVCIGLKQFEQLLKRGI